MSRYPIENVTGLILAGGESRRMHGRDKGLMDVCGQPMIRFVADTLAAQASEVWVSANRNADEYARYGRVLADPEHCAADDATRLRGPLAGIAAGLAAMETRWLLVVPCDAPCVPADLGPALEMIGRMLLWRSA